MAVVVSHDCTLDKQFNEYRTRLIAQGLPESEATELAEKRDDLDPTLLVAPVLLLTEVDPAYHASITQRIGYFPLADLPGLVEVPMVADLSGLTTIDHRLIEKTLISLDSKARSVLRYKLAEYFAYRPSSLKVLSTLIGRTVIDTDLVAQSKKYSRLTVMLDDGTQLTLDIKPPKEGEAEEEVVRSVGIRPPAQVIEHPAPPQSLPNRIITWWRNRRA